MATAKIVLIEDDKILSRVLNEELKESGFDVVQAFDGESGSEIAKREAPNLILLDILLPKRQGFDVLEELKRSPETQRIPVIIISMLGRDEDLKKGLQLGAVDYIVKSQHAVTEIVDKIKSFLAKEPSAKNIQI